MRGKTVTVKNALYWIYKWVTKLPYFIDEVYNRRRIHSALGYLLTRSPGPAASRLQSARHSFPKDDLFFREFLFAKCWEQGIHRQYADLLLGDGWAPLGVRLHEAFGEPRK